MYDYIFSGINYIVIQRGDVGPGFILEEYPKPISDLGWGTFGADGIDAALYSGSKCYFFDHGQYIRLTSTGGVGLGPVDAGYPRPISDWGWPNNFGARGIDAALWSGSVCFFFSGTQYIRVHRGDTDFGIVDPFYPQEISQGWLFDEYFRPSGGFATSGIDAALYSGSKTFFFSGSSYVQVSKGDLEPGPIDTLVPANISDWNWGNFGQTGIDAAFNNDGPLSPAPSSGLMSNTNYFLEDNGNILSGVSVVLALDQGLISEANGWSVQLNCYSQNAPSTVTEWQQFVIYSDDNNVWARIDNWKSLSTELIRADVLLATMPSAAISPGSSMSFYLITDTSNNVTGCTYSITYEGAALPNPLPKLTSPITKSITLSILTVSNLAGLPPVTSAELAPIVATQLNIVGDYGSHQSFFNTTSGTVSYSATQPLTATNTEPSYTVFNGITAETSNMAYGPLPQSANLGITQSFQVPPQITTHPDLLASRTEALKTKRKHTLPLPLHKEVEQARLKNAGGVAGFEHQLPLPLHLRDRKDQNIGMWTDSHVRTRRRLTSSTVSASTKPIQVPISDATPIFVTDVGVYFRRGPIPRCTS